MVCSFVLTKVEAKNFLQKQPTNVFILQGCSATFSYQGHVMQLNVVYDGSRCSRSSQAASLWMDGVLIQDGNCTDSAVDMACGGTCGIAQIFIDKKSFSLFKS